jgi:23S rRNA (uracil1939-C5)-methyltransferase
MELKRDEENGTVTVAITDIAFGGSGVGRADGCVIFVPFTAPGDLVEAKILTRKKNFAEAVLVRLLTPGPARTEPRCSLFGKCGGCAYQHLHYEEQLQIKARQVAETLRRVGRIAIPEIEPTVPAPHEYGYRNRIRIHVVDGEVGFFAHKSHRLIRVDRCEIAEDSVNDRLTDAHRRVPDDGDYLVTARHRAFFEQTNPAVAELLRAAVVTEVAENAASAEIIVDAYGGAGFFATALTAYARRVIGIEANDHAVMQARRGAAPNEEHLHGRVSELLPEVLESHASARVTLLMDPPATGLEVGVAEAILRHPPERILYISCNPATLARDIARLDNAYAVNRVRPFDMFPQTAEIEVLVALERRSAPQVLETEEGQ